MVKCNWAGKDESGEERNCGENAIPYGCVCLLHATNDELTYCIEEMVEDRMVAYVRTKAMQKQLENAARVATQVMERISEGVEIPESTRVIDHVTPRTVGG